MTSSAQNTKEVVTQESPPSTPVVAAFERPGLSPRTDSELRRACAKIVQESNSSGHDYQDQRDHHDAFEKHKSKRNTYKSSSPARPPKIQTQSGFFHKQPQQSSDRISGPASYTHVPKNAATSFEATAGLAGPMKRSAHARDNITFEPLEATHTTISSHSRRRQPPSEDPISQIRAVLDSRPKTSAAACIDYTGPSGDTSASTSRTNTTYDGIRPSTGVTSLAITPGDEKRFSALNHRVSEQVLRDGQSASLADATAKAWMAQELNRRRKEAYHGGYLNHPSRSPLNQHRQAEPERPVSRAGSIRDGIKEYIRPRASMDSVRSTRSESGLSRSNSRNSNSKGGNWWRGTGLKRKDSWNSFRSAKPDEDESAMTAAREGDLDLNRSLPPLPGLDQYKEKRPMPMHIAQMMRVGYSNGGPKQTKVEEGGQSTIMDDDSVERTRHVPDERERHIELRRAVEEKMRVGAISPPTSPGVSPLLRGHDHHLSIVSNGPSLGGGHKDPAVTVLEVPKTPISSKKGGLRKRLSRFLTGRR